MKARFTSKGRIRVPNVKRKPRVYDPADYKVVYRLVEGEYVGEKVRLDGTQSA